MVHNSKETAQPFGRAVPLCYTFFKLFLMQVA